MKKRRENKFKKNVKWVLGLVTILFLIGTYFFVNQNMMKASSKLDSGDFKLTTENKWSEEKQKNYTALEWDKIEELSQSGYQMYQSEDGKNWNRRSLNYGKTITVLNIYPDESGSNILENWMNELNLKTEDGNNLIQIIPVSLENYNKNPNKYLKDSEGEYKYDVLMFGFWNENNESDISKEAAEKTKMFIETGRGTLFSHGTVVNQKPVFYANFKNLLGLKNTQGKNLKEFVEAKLINDGHLMKYPFEMEKDIILNIPRTHNSELQDNNVGTTWFEFINSTEDQTSQTLDSRLEDWYLKTNNNVGMIQTGHSTEQVTTDEKKVIANTLYNLAEITLDSFANDQTVKDDQAPEKPKVNIGCGEDNNLIVKVDAVDVGKEYQRYIEATTKSNGIKKSNIVKETVKSNINGYFYELTDSATSNLEQKVESYKDSYGRIAVEKYDQYVVPDENLLEYETQSEFNIQEEKDSEKYLHVIAVDRANNVSEVSSQQVKNLAREIDFKIERTKNEAKLVGLTINSSLDNKMESLEIRIPKNTAIKGFDTLVLPTKWYSFENSETVDQDSFTFVIKEKNDLATIMKFLNELRFLIQSPTNQQGNIQIILHEKIYTSWIDPEGKTHYYSFEPTVLNWNDAYNAAKEKTYKGLKGYLTTLTSESEHNHVYDNIAKKSGWLGGARTVKKSGGKINDEQKISSNLADFDHSQSNWYWVNGPEAGLVFYDKKRYTEGGKAPNGVYQGFNNPVSGGNLAEPNNSGSGESVLEFAQESLSKYWNDLAISNQRFRTGYYVEYSEYGGQKEGIEPTDVSWANEIPQTVSLKAFDDKGNPLPVGNLSFENNLTINKKEVVTPIDIDFYDFIKMTNITGDVITPLEYTIRNTFQEGRLIYSNRKLTVHARQVVMNKNGQVVLPKKGFGRLETKTPTGENKSEFPLSMVSSDNNNALFDTYIIRYQISEPIYTFIPMIPMNYELVGYVLTTTNQQHNPGSSTQIPIQVDVSKTSEFWLTTYIKPVSTQPSFHHWEYKENKFGTIKIE